jgi:hypothetical protein
LVVSAPPAALPPPHNRVFFILRMIVSLAFRALADLVIPAPQAMLVRIGCLWQVQLLHVAARLRIADRVAERGKTAAELAEETGVSPDALNRALRALVTYGVFWMDSEGRVTNNRLAATLRSDRIASMRDPAEYFGSKSNVAAWADIDETIRTGEPAFSRVHGMSMWDWFAKHPDEARVFAGTMTSLTEQDAPAIAAAYDFGKHARICDVAGGRGTLLAEILAQHAGPAGPRGVLFDEAHVLEIASGYLAQRSVGERVERVAGTFFERVPEGCDAYVLKDILHDWDDARCTQILERVRAAMKEGSVLLVAEILVDRFSTRAPGPLVDTQMMTVCEGGRQRSAEEHAKLLASAGLKLRRVHATATAMSIVEAGVA